MAGCGLVMVDAAIVYRQEVFYGDTLRIEVAVTDLRRTRFDVVYRVTKTGSGDLAAEAKTGMAFFDYSERKVVQAPARFAALFQPKQS